MLSSPKAAAFTENFAGQWLKLREIAENEPDLVLYPEFDALLEYSMGQETRRFFDEVLQRDLSVMEFVDSDWSMLNDRLAEHYGIPGVSGAHFRRVTLPEGSVRGGLLTQASVLKVTANGTTTSPVVRGAWAIENLLGIHVPPPPPVPAVEPDLTGATTLRQQLDKHRNVTSCASCHSKIDPPGFALESFDAIGGWREWYRIPTGEALALDRRQEGGMAGHVQDADCRSIRPGRCRPGRRSGTSASSRRCSSVTPSGLRAASPRSCSPTDSAAAWDSRTAKPSRRSSRGPGRSDYGLQSLIQEIAASEAFARP